MSIEDIIDTLSKVINKGTLILHKSLSINQKFKAYKTFCYDLYYRNDNKSTLVLSYNDTKNVSSNDIDEAWKVYDKIYLEILIKWILTDEYKKVLDGI